MGGAGPRLGLLGFLFLSKLNRFSLIRVGWLRYIKTRNRTKLDIFQNILTDLINLFYQFKFFK
jgi:hypothetical protein